MNAEWLFRLIWFLIDLSSFFILLEKKFSFLFSFILFEEECSLVFLRFSSFFSFLFPKKAITVKCYLLCFQLFKADQKDKRKIMWELKRSNGFDKKTTNEEGFLRTRRDTFASEINKYKWQTKQFPLCFFRSID